MNIEAKVIAATAGGASGGVIGSFILWLLGVLVWHTPNDAGHSIQAVAAVPEPVGGFALFLLAGVMAFGTGYWAPHTHRPDLAAKKAAADSATSDAAAAAPAAPVEAAPAVSTPAEPEAPAAGVPPAAADAAAAAATPVA